MSTWSREKVQAEVSKLMSVTAKLSAETSKINRETFWYPLAISTAFVIAVITITKVFL